MPLKSILVHIDESERCKERIGMAAQLAMSHGAHLTGLYVIPDPYIPPYMAAGFIPVDVIENQVREARRHAAEMETVFNDITGKAGAESEWRIGEGLLADTVSRHARYADVTIVGKGDAHDREHFPNPGLGADVVMGSGRPVLVVPNAGHFDNVGKNILVCWNASRESTRAVNDAMPMMQSADKVAVLSVNPHSRTGGDHGDIPGADIALHLARHDVKVEATSAVAGDMDVADVVLARASDLGADMIVCGAYGHSRTREWVLGGVTESLLHDTTVPTMLSH